MSSNEIIMQRKRYLESPNHNKGMLKKIGEQLWVNNYEFFATGAPPFKAIQAGSVWGK